MSTTKSDLILDRGRGPEIVGRRITVYDLVPYFLEADTTEDLVCKIYELRPEQVAAARAYVLNHFEEVMAVHRRIEARNAAGNPPEVRERLERAHVAFEAYRRQWEERKRIEGAGNGAGQTKPDALDANLTFREWIVRRELPRVET